MDTPSLLEYLVGAVVGLLSWNARKADSKIENLDKSLSDHKVKVVETFLAKEDYREDMKEIKAGIAHIINKIDGKADKQ